MRLKLLTLALALSAVALPGHGEDLLDAYREARTNDPVLSQADATRLSVHEGVAQNRALLLPQISAGLTLNQSSNGGKGRDENGDTYDFGHSRTRTISGEVDQTIFDLSKIANLRAAHSQSDAQSELYQAALQNLFVRVTQAYFNVLTSEDALEFAKASEASFKRQLDQAQQRFDVGLSAITDVYDAKAQHDLATAQVISAENTLNDMREALTQITGKPATDLKKLRDDLPMDAPAPNDPNAWVAQALKTNPNILSQQYSVEAANHSVNSARAGHLPTVNAQLIRSKNSTWLENGRLSSQGAGAGNGRFGNTIGLTLRVPIFEGGATQSRVRQSIYDRDAAQDGLEIQRRQVTRDTLNYYRSVIAGISQVEASKAAVTSAESALAASQAGFEVGTRTIVEVLIAQQNLTQAQSNYSQTRHQFVLNKLLLKQAAGTADLKDVEAINALLQ
ncbi:type I secretion protein TolC [Frateuria sp. Soil773]|uniref:TolC family outer membrane protein n=1 Tax=Frateuria sp. Soil773 TaxID=1736407 RepID=UPI0006FB1647|nr:TolC family outer membrane protein [Frateuria sp. Soil773]KRE96541.1 type I secretion protein TolC [Frateuria sp. Soil773]